VIGRSLRSANLYVALAVLALAVLAQGTLLSRLRLLGATPNLFLVIVVCWSLVRSIDEGLVWGFLGGLGLDLIAGAPLGMLAIALMVPCFLSALGRNRVFAGNMLLPVMLVAAATPIHGWIITGIQQVRGLPVNWPEITLRVVLPEMGLNVAMTLLAYPLLRWLSDRLHGRSTEP
jgi:rod shape-determining protein MreD